MRRLLIGYAIAFNRCHHRVGHLFQNRYKSIVVEADTYFRELVRYLHLNPLRAKLVADLGARDRYPWAGHATVVGRLSRPWQDRQALATSPSQALKARFCCEKALLMWTKNKISELGIGSAYLSTEVFHDQRLRYPMANPPSQRSGLTSPATWPSILRTRNPGCAHNP